MAKEYDPLAVIPSGKAIRQRLVAIEEQARKLRILLVTAEGIETGQQVNGTIESRVPTPEEIRQEMTANSERNRVLRSIYRVSRKIHKA